MSLVYSHSTMPDDTFECRLCQTTTTHIFSCRDCHSLFCRDHIEEDDHYCGASVYGAELPNGSTYYFPVRGWRASLISRTSGRKSNVGTILSLLFASPVTLAVLTLLVVWFPFQMWALQELGGLDGMELPAEWIQLFALHPDNIHYVWTWFTSIISHGGALHLLINGLVLAMFGPFVERNIGSKRFAMFFIIAGVVAGLLQVGVTALVGAEAVPVLGASGAIAGILGAHAVFEPDSEVHLLFIFPMSMWVAVAVLTFGSYLIPFVWGIGAGNIAHLAHAGGATVGLLYGWSHDSSALTQHLAGVADAWNTRLMR